MDSEKTSPWIDTEPGSAYPSLTGDLTVDVAIVGAGITGLTAGVLLSSSGLRVAIVDAGLFARGDTGSTTAHLTAVLDSRYRSLTAKFGEDGARLAAASQVAAIDRIAQFVSELDIDCDFQRVPGYLYAARREQRAVIEAELEAAGRAGLRCELAKELPLPFATDHAILFPDQAQFHPRKYLQRLAQLIAARGGYLFERTRVREVKDEQPAKLITESGTINARAVLVATHTPVNTRVRMHTKLVPYRTYVLGVLRGAAFPPGLFWDTEEPYHYLRKHSFAEGEVVLVGGADHKVGHQSDTHRPFVELERYTRAHLGAHAVRYRWSGQVFETLDGLPYVGKLSEHSYVATGYWGNGMTHGTMAAMLLSDLVLGRENPWAELYDPKRVKPLASAKRFVLAQADVAKRLVGDRLKKGDGTTPADVPAGEGRIIDHRGRKLAVYRDPAGVVNVLSANCTHMGCVVQFNSAEKSWDCPCHGSRFDVDGEVIEGPAVRPLSRTAAADSPDEKPDRKLG